MGSGLLMMFPNQFVYDKFMFVVAKFLFYFSKEILVKHILRQKKHNSKSFYV